LGACSADFGIGFGGAAADFVVVAFRCLVLLLPVDVLVLVLPLVLLSFSFGLSKIKLAVKQTVKRTRKILTTEEVRFNAA
jgi:uncharacterized membrane protein